MRGVLGRCPVDEADESTVEAGDEPVYRLRVHTHILLLETEASHAGCMRRPIILMNSPTQEPHPFMTGLLMLAETPHSYEKLAISRHNNTYSCLNCINLCQLLTPRKVPPAVCAA